MKNVAVLVMVIGVLALPVGGFFGTQGGGSVPTLLSTLVGVCGLGLGAVVLVLERVVEAVNRNTQVAINEAKLADARRADGKL